jgi:hypothetical protein
MPRKLRSRGLVDCHHTSLLPDEVTILRGIPVTTVPRTLLDLAAVVPRRQLERAINEAEVMHLFDALSLADLVDRYPRRPGTPVIRAILAAGYGDATITRNDFERDFLDLLDGRGSP